VGKMLNAAEAERWNTDPGYRRTRSIVPRHPYQLAISSTRASDSGATMPVMSPEAEQLLGHT
jgi:hypothetical protein